MVIFVFIFSSPLWSCTTRASLSKWLEPWLTGRSCSFRLACFFSDILTRCGFTRFWCHSFICVSELSFKGFLQIDDLKNSNKVFKIWLQIQKNWIERPPLTSCSICSLCLIRRAFSVLALLICSSMQARTVSQDWHHSWRVAAILWTSSGRISRPRAKSISNWLFFWSNLPWIISVRWKLCYVKLT